MKGLNSVQIEQLRQVGCYLLEVRQDQGIPLEKIAKDTFIPLRLLEALEVGDTARLPEPVYVKGFIRRYGDALGLNGTEIADAFEIEAAPVKQPLSAPTPELTVYDAPAPVAAPVERYPEQRSPVRPQQSKFPVWAYVLSGVAALGIAGAIGYGMKNTFQATSTNLSAVQPTVGTPSSPSESMMPNSTAGNNQTTPADPSLVTVPSPKSTSNDPVQVDVSLTDRSWMEVVADGKVKFEGILSKGEQRTWTAKNTLLIRAGNAGAVVASYNQGQAKPLGRLGDVVDASFPR
jgi:cytoskeletal protein RodZ